MTLMEEVIEKVRSTAADQQQRGVSFFTEDHEEAKDQAEHCRRELDELFSDLAKDNPLLHVDVWARGPRTEKPGAPHLSDSERRNEIGLRVSWYSDPRPRRLRGGRR